MMVFLLQSFKFSFWLCALDDVIIFFPTFETHLQRISVILAVFPLAGLQPKSSK